MEVTTISGNVHLDCATLRYLTANSTSGDVTLILPEEMGYTLEFDSVSGSAVSSSFDVFGDSFRYTHGNGAAQLRVNTISGWFYLE